MVMSRKKVLWVDDEIEFLRSHIMFLETRGYSVTPVFSGDDAIHLIENKLDEFDIVLLDEQMPGKSGLATLDEIKMIAPDLPVVMVTKSEEEELMEKALGRKINGYLTKPVNPSQILLVCKRLLHSKEFMSSQLKQDFIRNFSANRESLQGKMSALEWAKIYRNISKWDIELENTKDEGIRQAHAGQKSDANALFSGFIVANYMRWMNGEGDPPLFSPHVIDEYIIPQLQSSGTTYFVVLDSMRLDQYMMIQSLLKKYFHIDDYTYYSILPSTAEYARISLMAGMYPKEIRKQSPKLWSEAQQNIYSKNNKEGTFLKKKLASCGLKLGNAIEFIKLTNESKAQDIIDNIDKYKKKKIVTFVVEFVDKLIREHATTELIQDIVPDENAFRRLTYSWFERSNIYEILKTLSHQDCKVIFTTSNGSILCTRGTELYGGPSTMANLRYQSGKNITCDERYALYIHEPARFNLPKKTKDTNYVVLKENFYFINHGTYRNYNEQYQNTFQRGGISMEEMIVPLAVMQPKEIEV